MTGRRKVPLWRQAFLRALRRTGTVRAAAFEAGVDPGTAYDHRAKDPAFAGKWAEAKAAYRRRPSPQPSPAGGRGGKEELVLRRTKHGDRLVRASPGRWSARIEASFLDGLEETGCVRTSARAAGISTAALYERRDHYPEFRARWEERLERNRAQLPGLINAAAVASMSPQPEGAKRRGRARLPKLSAGEAIRVFAINQNAMARAGGRRGGEGKPQRDEAKEREELVETGVKLVGMMKRRREKQRLAEGWTDAGNGVWLPPGWTVQRPPETPAGEDGDPPSP